MKELLSNSVLFAVLISILAYEAGVLLRKKWNFGLFHPLLHAIVIVIIILLAFDIDYEVYSDGAKYLTYLLTPATVCLAIPLYEQIEILKKNWKAIVAGIVSGVITSGICILIMARAFQLDHRMFVTLLPKSVTTAIGMGISEELGGIVTITVAVIIITGVLGNVSAGLICKIFGISEPVARGIGIGTSAHAIGTARALEMGQIEGAMSSLSIAVSGILTVVAANIFSMLY